MKKSSNQIYIRRKCHNMTRLDKIHRRCEEPLPGLSHLQAESLGLLLPPLRLLHHPEGGTARTNQGQEGEVTRAKIKSKNRITADGGSRRATPVHDELSLADPLLHHDPLLLGLDDRHLDSLYLRLGLAGGEVVVSHNTRQKQKLGFYY